MSGRVGDLSPKQEEALAKVSLLLACLWPSLLAERRLRETVLAGGRLSRPRLASAQRTTSPSG